MTEATDQRPPATPHEVVRRIHHLAQVDISAQADLYAPDGVLEWPFAPDGTPRRVEGREEIRRVLTGLAAAVSRGQTSIRGLCSFHLHETSDPEVVIVEFEADAEHAGEPLTLPYVQVFRIRDGQIRHFRDYFGPRTAGAVRAAFEDMAAEPALAR